MSRRSRDTDELIRQKVLLGSQLAMKRPGYVNYAGGNYFQGRKMGFIAFIIKNRLVDNRWIPILKLCYDYLDEDRKVWFMTDGSDILTKLSALVGGDIAISATAPANE